MQLSYICSLTRELSLDADTDTSPPDLKNTFQGRGLNNNINQQMHSRQSTYPQVKKHDIYIQKNFGWLLCHSGALNHFLTRVPNPPHSVEQTRPIFSLCTFLLYTAQHIHAVFPLFFLLFLVPLCTTLLSLFLNSSVGSGDHGSESCLHYP